MASDSGQAKRLPLGLKLAYGLPCFPGSAMAIPIGVYMTKFYSDTVGVALGFIALAQVLARSVDAVSDPLMGWISDRTRTRWGRRRPWMLLGAPFAAISMVVLFGPPSDIDPLGGAVWFTLSFMAYYLFLTIYSIPHNALGLELTPDYHERSNLFAWRNALNLAGIAFAASTPAFLVAWAKTRGAEQADAERAVFLWFSVGMSALLIASYGWLCYRVPENPSFAQREANPLIPGVRRVFRVRPFRILLVCFLATSVTGQLYGFLLPFYLQYAIGVENWVEWVGVTVLTSYGLGALTLPLWLRLARRFGKKPVYISTFALTLVFDLGLLVLPSFAMGEVAARWMIGFFLIKGATFAGGSFLAPSMQAEVIDYDELLTGRRREAQYSALWEIVTKFASIPSLAIPLVVLAALGFEPNVEQAEEVRWAIRIIMGGASAVIVFAGMCFAFRFPIDERIHGATQSAIAAHGRGEAATDPLTGQELAPPRGGDVDEETGWFLDHFSRGELRRALRAGALAGRGLRRDVTRALLLSAVVFAASSAGVWASLTDPGSGPGFLTLTGVLLAGISFTALCFHGIRLGAARQIGELPTVEVRAHLEATERAMG